MKLGFIGLGAMGRPMALRLLAAGHELRVWSRRSEISRTLAAAGAVPCATPADMAAAVDVVFTMVTGSEDVRQVIFGTQGVAQGLRTGALVIDCSTIAIDAAREIAVQMAARGCGFLDAPVSGGSMGAEAGTLAIMAGGEARDFARARPLFDCLAKTVVHVGPAGAGQIAKACNQLVMVAAIEATAEAARLASASGCDFERVRTALAQGSAGSRVLEFFGAKMAKEDFVAGVEARLHHKDYAMTMNSAAAVGAPLPVAAQVWQQLNALMAAGGGLGDTSALLRVLEGSIP